MSSKPGGRALCSNVTAEKLIRNAFTVERSRITGAPSWADSDSYDIEAKTADAVEITRDNTPALLLSLLETRFGLRYRRESKVISGYALEIGRDGPKLHPHDDAKQPGMSTNSSGGLISMKATGISLGDLALALTRQLATPVENHTGIAGTYDFQMDWSTADAADSAAPSIYSVLKALGLKLTPAKVSTTIIAIDRLEKPSDN